MIDPSVAIRLGMHGAYLHGADLHGADLHGADLHGANLTGANLTGANLTGADRPEGVPGWTVDPYGYLTRTA